MFLPHLSIDADVYDHFLTLARFPTRLLKFISPFPYHFYCMASTQGHVLGVLEVVGVTITWSGRPSNLFPYLVPIARRSHKLAASFDWSSVIGCMIRTRSLAGRASRLASGLANVSIKCQDESKLLPERAFIDIQSSRLQWRNIWFRNSVRWPTTLSKYDNEKLNIFFRSDRGSLNIRLWLSDFIAVWFWMILVYGWWLSLFCVSFTSKGKFRVQSGAREKNVTFLTRLSGPSSGLSSMFLMFAPLDKREKVKENLAGNYPTWQPCPTSVRPLSWAYYGSVTMTGEYLMVSNVTNCNIIVSYNGHWR